MDERWNCLMFGALIRGSNPGTYRLFLIQRGEDTGQYQPFITVRPTADVTAEMLEKLVGHVVGLDGVAIGKAFRRSMAADAVEPARAVPVIMKALFVGVRYTEIDAYRREFFPPAPALEDAPEGATFRNLSVADAQFARVGDRIQIAYMALDRTVKIQLADGPRPFDTWSTTRKGSTVTIEAVIKRPGTVNIAFVAEGADSLEEQVAKFTAVDANLAGPGKTL